LTRVGLDEDWEVRYWCTVYGVSDEHLRACVKQVGPSAVDVERHLRETGGGKKIFSNTGED
jgi:hypothetical protein